MWLLEDGEFDEGLKGIYEFGNSGFFGMDKLSLVEAMRLDMLPNSNFFEDGRYVHIVMLLYLEVHIFEQVTGLLL